MLTVAHMPPLMFGGLIVFLLIGFPVAFSLAALGLFFGLLSPSSWAISPELPRQPAAPRVRHPVQRPAAGDPVLHLHGRDPGALRPGRGPARGHRPAVRPGAAAASPTPSIIVGAILGAITGTVAASVIAMGVISLPIMMRYGYDMRIATGVIAASGTITQLIPPSLVLVVLADQLGRSVGDMYAGAIGPSHPAGRCCSCSTSPSVALFTPASRAAAAAGGARRCAAGRWCGASAVGHGARRSS